MFKIKGLLIHPLSDPISRFVKNQGCYCKWYHHHYYHDAMPCGPFTAMVWREIDTSSVFESRDEWCGLSGEFGWVSSRRFEGSQRAFKPKEIHRFQDPFRHQDPDLTVSTVSTTPETCGQWTTKGKLPKLPRISKIDSKAPKAYKSEIRPFAFSQNDLRLFNNHVIWNAWIMRMREYFLIELPVWISDSAKFLRQCQMYHCLWVYISHITLDY